MSENDIIEKAREFVINDYGKKINEHITYIIGLNIFSLITWQIIKSIYFFTLLIIILTLILYFVLRIFYWSVFLTILYRIKSNELIKYKAEEGNLFYDYKYLFIQLVVKKLKDEVEDKSTVELIGKYKIKLAIFSRNFIKSIVCCFLLSSLIVFLIIILIYFNKFILIFNFLIRYLRN